MTKSKCPTKRAPTVLVTPRKSNDTRNMPTVILKTVGLCATTRKLLTVAGNGSDGGFYFHLYLHLAGRTDTMNHSIAVRSIYEIILSGIILNILRYTLQKFLGIIYCC